MKQQCLYTWCSCRQFCWWGCRRWDYWQWWWRWWWWFSCRVIKRVYLIPYITTGYYKSPSLLSITTLWYINLNPRQAVVAIQSTQIRGALQKCIMVSKFGTGTLCRANLWVEFPDAVRFLRLSNKGLSTLLKASTSGTSPVA